MRNHELETQLDPDDDQSCLVYGDWLQQHGEPHGELIQIQHALLAEPRSVVLRRREAELIEAQAAELVGPSLVDSIHLLEWHCGFVRGGQLDETQYRELRARTTGLLLTSLVAPGAVVPAVIEDPPPLRLFTLANGAELDGLWSALPALTVLALHAGELAMGDIEHAQLERLEIRPDVLSNDVAEALARAKLPALRTLELLFEGFEDEGYRWFAGAQARSPVQVERVARILANLPMLEDLSLLNTNLGDPMVLALANAPCAKTLKTLDLTSGAVTEFGARTLADKAKFPALSKLTVVENQIHSPVLEGVFPWFRFGPQYQP